MDTVVDEPDINVAVDNLYKIIDTAKSKAYGKTTITAKKLKRVEEEKEWRRRVMEIDAFVEDIEAKYFKPMTRVWAARKGILMEGRYAEDSLDELALKAHPTKSVRIEVGRQQERDAVEEENSRDPETIQGFEVKSIEKDMYLGHTEFFFLMQSE